MIQFICYFFPSIIAVWLTEIFINENFNTKKCIYHFVLYTILINAIIFLTISLLFNPEIDFLAMNGFSYLFTIKYLSMSLILALSISIIYKIIKSNIMLSLEINNYEEKKQKKKNTK